MKVFIVGSLGGCQYADMYQADGWEIVTNLEEANLVQFTGGHDVSPDLYGCGQHPATMNSKERDVEEEQVYRHCEAFHKPMVGICRGGQFLNVMNGGRMYQHVDGHGIAGTHKVQDSMSPSEFDVTSTHHQMMIPNKENAEVIGSTFPSLCSRKEYVDTDNEIFVVIPDENEKDTEVLFYPWTKSLCFQPHPEYAEGKACREWFFSLVMGKLFNDWRRYEALTGADMRYYNEDGDVMEAFEE